MIEVQGISKVYENDPEDILAVDSLSFKIKKGSIVALLGPNGAGKTSTVRILSTIIRPSLGTAYIDGIDIRENPMKIRENLGLASESPNLYNRLSAERNLRFFADLHQLPKDEKKSRIDDLLKKFDLYDVKYHKVGSFSKGMKQKLSLCKALIHNPETVIFDEPWSGLSPHASREVSQLIQELSSDHNRTILISTHNLAQVERIVDKLLIIQYGKLVDKGSPAELIEKFHVLSQVKLKIQPNKNIESIINSFNAMKILENYDNMELLIELETTNQIPIMVEGLVQNKVKILELTPQVPSIEEIYFNLIKEE